jgi:Rps23 Pro-64 3,4-dihydroxylase Tpa1-like proline 4-hydroxylase
MGAQHTAEVLVPNLDTAFIRDANGQAVASIYGANGACHQDPTSTARTLLFAAAPELLTEAERAADQLDFVLGTLRSLKRAGYEVSATVIAETEEIMDACYAAIAKAKGSAA